MADRNNDPWAEVGNQAVGALYKYYMSKPSAADLQKNEYVKAQTERLNMQNQLDQRSMGLGDFTLQNLSPEIRNDLYRRSLDTRGDTDGAKLFGTYVNKPMQVDAGDAKFVVDGSTGLPLPGAEYGVGTAPKVEVDTQGGRVIRTPGVPALNRPAVPPLQGEVSPVADLLGSFIQQQSGGAPSTMPPPLAGTEDPQSAWASAMRDMAQTQGLSPATGDIPQPVVSGTAGQPQQRPAVPAAAQPIVQPDGTTITDLPMSPVAKQKQGERERLKGIQGDLVNDELNRALNVLDEKGGTVAGLGSVTSGIPMLPAHDFAQMLDTIKANVGFDKLQSMREASPTGGALGQVSEFENKLLQAVFGSLAQSQSPEQLRYNMMRLQNTYNNIIYRGYNEDGSLRMQNNIGPAPYNIPTLEGVGAMNTPEELQGALEFFNYDPPQDIKNAIIQRANVLGL